MYGTTAKHCSAFKAVADEVLDYCPECNPHSALFSTFQTSARQAVPISTHSQIPEVRKEPVTVKDHLLEMKRKAKLGVL